MMKLEAAATYHHRIVDGDETTYTVEMLVSMKRRHEAYASTRPRFEISDGLAERIKKAMATGAAIGTAMAVVEGARDFGPAVKWLLDLFSVGATGRPDERVKRRLSNVLAYGPKGTFQFGSHAPRCLHVGAALAGILQKAGWRAQQVPVTFISDVARHHRINPLNLIVVVTMADENRLPNAQRTMTEFLRECGFVPASDRDEFDGPGRDGVRVLLLYGRKGA